MKSFFKKSSLILAINLIILPYFNSVYASQNSFYNRNGIYILNQNDNCINQDIALTANSSIGTNSQKLSKKIMKINNPEKFAQAIDQWIEKSSPNSPMKGLGKFAVAGGQRTGINPILPIIIARKESGLGIAGQISKTGNNAYGRMATKSQPHVGTSRLWYRWPSFQQSLFSDTQDDMYHYINQVYQQQNTIEEVMMKYAPPFENNTDLYIKQLHQWAGEIYQLAGDSIDVKSLGSINNYNYTNCNSAQNFNSINGFNMYYQFDAPWANHIFTPACGNIKQCGCGPTSISIVLSNLLKDNSITPVSISDQMNGMKLRQGTTFSAFSIIPKRYNLTSQALGTNIYQAKKAIEEGKLVIMSQGPGKFTRSGHIMVIRGFTADSKILVADPNSKKFTENQQGFDVSVITASLKGMWAIGS